MLPFWLEDLLADTQALLWDWAGLWIREQLILMGYVAIAVAAIVALLFAARRA